MKLYFSPGACSLAPHIVARELGIPLELVKTDTKTKRSADGADFLQLNPKGYVPALVRDDGAVLTEGPVISQYLADSKPGNGLLAATGTPQRYQVLEMLGFLNSEVHKTYSPLFSPDTPEAARAASKETLRKRYAFVESRLDGSGFLFGEAFTAADAYLFVLTNWARHVELDLSAFPKVLAHQKRVAARPAVQEAMRAEGLLK